MDAAALDARGWSARQATRSISEPGERDGRFLSVPSASLDVFKQTEAMMCDDCSGGSARGTT